MEIKRITKQQILLLLFVLLVLFTLPVIVYLTKKRQEIRPRALQGQANLLLSSDLNGQAKVGDTFTVVASLQLNSAQNSSLKVSGVDFVLLYDKSKLAVINTVPALSAVMANGLFTDAPVVTFGGNFDDTTSFLRVSEIVKKKTEDLQSGTFPLARITFRALSAGDASIRFADDQYIQIVGISCVPRPSCLDDTPPCSIPETPDMCPRPSITPIGPTATPSPTGTIATPTPTLSPLLTKTVCVTGTPGQNGCDYIGASGIQSAVDAVPDGGTVLIKNGTYNKVGVQVGTKHPNKHNITIKGESLNSILNGISKGGIFDITGDSIVDIQQLTIAKAQNNAVSYFDTTQGKVTGNIIKNSKYSGILASANSKVEIKNNLLISNGYDGVQLDLNAIADIVNNTLYGNKNHGVECGTGAASRCTTINNISVKNDHTGYSGSTPKNFTVLMYNLSYNNGSGNYNAPKKSGFPSKWPPATNKSAGPKFVSNSNFHLQSDSPAKNAGDPTILDPDGTPSDMGAYGGPGACGLEPTLPGCT